MTLSPIHWVPVQDKRSKILCVKLGAMTITPSDPLHQEYLTMNLGNSSDWRQLQLLLVSLWKRCRGISWATGAYWGKGRGPWSLTHSLTHSPSRSLTISVQKMQKQEQKHANSCFRHWNIQDERSGGLWDLSLRYILIFFLKVIVIYGLSTRW